MQCFHISIPLSDAPLFDLWGQSRCKNTFQSIIIYACLLGAARCSAEGRLIWNYSSVPDLLVSRQHPGAFSALWQTSLFWRCRQAPRSPGVPPAGETPNRREEGMLCNEFQTPVSSLKSLSLDVGCLAFAVNLQQNIYLPPRAALESHNLRRERAHVKLSAAAGMTDQTCTIMNINLRRHNSCQLHGVETGSSVRRDLCFCLGLSDILRLCSPRKTFVFFVQRPSAKLLSVPRTSEFSLYWRNGDRMSQETDKMQRWTTVTCLVVFKFQIAKGWDEWKQPFFNTNKA